MFRRRMQVAAAVVLAVWILQAIPAAHAGGTSASMQGHKDDSGNTRQHGWIKVVGGAGVAVVAIVILKLGLGCCPGTFDDIKVPPGWTVESDGEYFVRLTPTKPINDAAELEMEFTSVVDFPQGFIWRTVTYAGRDGAQPAVVEQGSFASQGASPLPGTTLEVDGIIEVPVPVAFFEDGAAYFPALNILPALGVTNVRAEGQSVVGMLGAHVVRFTAGSREVRIGVSAKRISRMPIWSEGKLWLSARTPEELLGLRTSYDAVTKRVVVVGVISRPSQTATKRLMSALTAYMQDYEVQTYSETWAYDLLPYLGQVVSGWALNRKLVGVNMADIRDYAQTVLFFETHRKDVSAVGGPEDIREGLNLVHVLFVDGHTEPVRRAQLEAMLQ